ncbi:hypothetical protein PR202_gb11796 [Eleusine coracana subsp. coracana]|uniref:Uncharacterized protein n=1 Tax=Eleusine coracana subsp. coracana TaxID=191504 RepID=A0AAV5ENF4_ELECO|nr:hypothetical protein PR202_gb11796 [Eleusine coracana subsp. coracana]
MAAASSTSLATTCLLALLLAVCLAAALPSADARRLLATAMSPVGVDSPAPAPAPVSGADHAGRMLFEGGLRLAGRMLSGLGF